MKKFVFKKYKIRIYTDPKSFLRMPEQPMGYLPKNAVLDEKFTIEHMTGFISHNDSIIRLLVHPKCKFTDLLRVVSHELGHKTEGGFKKNPPDKTRYYKLHEKKAQHYEVFSLDAYNLTCKIFKKLGINGKF